MTYKHLAITGSILFLSAMGVTLAQAQKQSPIPSRMGIRVLTAPPAVQNAAPPAKSESPLYTFSFGLIDFPRSQVSGLWGINDSGKMVGGYNNTNIEGYFADHGYELKKDTFSTIDYPGAGVTELFAINKAGEIVGAFGNTDNDCCHGFKLVSGVYTQLDCPGSSFTVALGVNSSGEIVGFCDGEGFLLSGGVYTIISVPGALYTYTEGINKYGVIAGYYFDSSMNSHGFTWDKGTITTIDYGNGYPNTYLAGINDSGVIVGGYGSWQTIGSISDPWQHGFLYSGGTFSTFDAPFGDVQWSQPWSLNNKGEVVGDYVDSQGMLYGFYLKEQ